MTTTARTTAVGVFPDRALAERAIQELHTTGFSDDQIGFVIRDTPIENSSATSATLPDAATGAVGGGIIGGFIGAATALLIPGLGLAIAGGILISMFGGVALGAVAGGFVGSFVRMGIPEDEAQRYQEQLAKGNVIVTVAAPGRYEEAARLLRECGAFDTSVHPDLPDLDTPAVAADTSNTDVIDPEAAAAVTEAAIPLEEGLGVSSPATPFFPTTVPSALSASPEHSPVLPPDPARHEE